MVDYADWEKGVPAVLKQDPLWRVTAYRLSLFAADAGWPDVTRLGQDRRTLSLADQLYRALGSVSSNIAEGYSRGTGKDRARFYEYALGSARESRDWYFKARHVLGELLVQQRLELLTEVTRLLLVMIPDQRCGTLREELATYTTATDAEKVRADTSGPYPVENTTLLEP